MKESPIIAITGTVRPKKRLLLLYASKSKQFVVIIFYLVH